MTISQAPSTGSVSWAQVEPGFYVGSRAGAFVGYIDRRGDGFEAFDLYSRPLGTYPDLNSARRALNSNETGSAA